MNKVALGEMFILIIYTEKAFAPINSHQMWMNFNTFSSSSRADGAIQIKFNLDEVEKRMEVVTSKRCQSK